MRKQFVFNDQTVAEKYIEDISKEIMPIFKKLPSFSNYSELEYLGEPFRKEVQKILSKYDGVVGSDGYYVLGNKSLNPLTKLYFSKYKKESQSPIPVDFSIWASFKYGHITMTFSNIRHEERITKEYFEQSNHRRDRYIDQSYDKIQAGYLASSKVKSFSKKEYFDRLHGNSNNESPEEYLKKAVA